MSLWSRTDNSPLSRWWWTVDRATLIAVFALMAAGLVLVLAASAPIAARHQLPPLHFFMRQLVFVGPSIALMLGLSLVSLEQIRRWALPAFGLVYLLLLCTLLFGANMNGASRWLSIGSFTLQPSEFLKPFFVIVLATVMCDESRFQGIKRYGIAAALLVLVSVPLVLQPDYGQTALIGMAWGAILFLSGLSIFVMAIVVALAAAAAYWVYTHVDHVAERVNGFIDPASTDTYQVRQALSAFEAGGLGGAGMGEGRVKWNLPDAHTDFIFAVAGEEFGMFACLAMLGAFLFIIFRGYMRAMHETNHFVQLAAAGLVTLIALQAFINLGVNVHILPAKGMTLPFISYGGSSLLAVSITLGLLLALTRRRVRGGLPHHLVARRRTR